MARMETGRWFNRAQPQTLQIAVFLLYFNAAFDVLDLLSERRVSLTEVVRYRYDFGILIVLAIIASEIFGGKGVANEKRWGYGLALAAAFSPMVLRVWLFGLGDVLNTDLLGLMFEIALIALLLHPQSRDYQRVWFR